MNNPISNNILVFDIGGTNIRAAAYSSETGRLRNIIRKEIANHLNFPRASFEEIQERLFNDIYFLASQVFGNIDPNFVSIAFPGPLNPQGAVLAAPTIWSNRYTKPFNVVDVLKTQWPGAKIYILNDVTAAGFRYLSHAKEDLCVVTVSSGIGHKVFIGGQPVVGPHGRGGEIGHLRVDFSEKAQNCDCGEPGHLAAVSSGRGSVYHARKLAESDLPAFRNSYVGSQIKGDVTRINNILIVEAFKHHDEWSIQLIKQMAAPLGQALASIHLGIGVERFVIVGGFALALGNEYVNLLADAAAKSAWKVGADWGDMVELGLPDDDSGLIGAGRYVEVMTKTSKGNALC